MCKSCQCFWGNYERNYYPRTLYTPNPHHNTHSHTPPLVQYGDGQVGRSLQSTPGPRANNPTPPSPRQPHTAVQTLVKVRNSDAVRN